MYTQIWCDDTMCSCDNMLTASNPFSSKSIYVAMCAEYGPVHMKIKLPKKTSCMYICQHCLVHLGDIGEQMSQFTVCFVALLIFTCSSQSHSGHSLKSTFPWLTCADNVENVMHCRCNFVLFKFNTLDMYLCHYHRLLPSYGLIGCT